MNLLVKLLELHTPGIVKERALRALFEGTAAAFRCPPPPREGRTYEERLAAYARFTAEQAERAIQAGDDLEGLRDRLFQQASSLGRRLRGALGIADNRDVLDLGRVLYRAIGIDLRGDAGGEVTIGRCFFSDHYTSGVCRVVSALDDGLFAGLSGGGRLVFRQRITEGYDCCKARLIPAECAGLARAESPSGGTRQWHDPPVREQVP
jgi:hypothetical protein